MIRFPTLTWKILFPNLNVGGAIAIARGSCMHRIRLGWLAMRAYLLYYQPLRFVDWEITTRCLWYIVDTARAKIDDNVDPRVSADCNSRTVSVITREFSTDSPSS